MIVSMDLTRLRIFVSVAERGSFAAAASALDYTPSAISQQMARLEAEVGARLLERTGRGSALTEAGETLLPHARVILDRVGRAQHELDVLSGARANELRLAAFATAATTIVAPVLRELRDRHPELEATLRELEPFDALRAVRDREVDLAVVYQREGYDLGQDWCGRRVVEVDGVLVERLLSEPYLLAVPSGHRLAGGADAAALDGERLIGNEYWPGLTALAARLRAAGSAPVFDGLFSQSYATVLDLVRAGEGLALVPSLAAGDVPGIAFAPLGELAPVRDIDLVSLPGGSTPAVTTARAMIQAAAARV
jgi:DNA-binding transcriptional LysR family regulator